MPEHYAEIRRKVQVRFRRRNMEYIHREKPPVSTTGDIDDLIYGTDSGGPSER